MDEAEKQYQYHLRNLRMITVEQLKEMSDNQPIGGGFPMSIKTFKKKWQVKDIWYQQVILFDDTGEIPADVKLGPKYNPLNCAVIEVIVAKVRDAEYLNKPCKILYVDQWRYPLGDADELSNFDRYQIGLKPIQEIEGMIRHGLVCALIQTGELRPSEISPEIKMLINHLVEFVKTGQ